MRTIKLILYTFRDLIIRFLPKTITKRMVRKVEFAFLVHPRDLKDVSIKYPFTKFFPIWFVKFCVKHLWPVVVSPITGLKNKQGEDISGYVIGCPMLAHQMMKNRPLSLKRIIQATKLAEKVGAKIIGLGALTSSLTRGGLDLKGKINIDVTSGYIYTAITVSGYVIQIAKELDIDLNSAKIAIVGVAGNVGSNSAILLAEQGVKNLLLVDLLRKRDRVEMLMNNLRNKNLNISFKYSDKIKDISDSDIIIAATNAPGTVIRSSDLKPGVVVVDDAQPSDVDEDVFKNRNDIMILEGGAVKTPGINAHFNFGLPGKENNFSCLAEVLILTSLEEKIEYTPEQINKEAIDKIKEGAKDLNFSLGDFQNAFLLYSSQDIERIKKIRQKNST